VRSLNAGCRLLAASAVLAAPAVAADLPSLDDRAWDDLRSASEAVFALPDKTDAERFHRPDYWEAAGPDGGDCEDKALLARAMLRARGWPGASLKLALAWTESGEYHAVLTVDVIRKGQPATYVIDPRFGWVLPWDALTRFGYRWDRRQADTRSGWVRIGATTP
jgi:predicted transglutaminase-like cysteine proteinase